jgi:tRNA U34 5-carboxymethylaminomethyl modifying GTPase MnmE/TrmE
VSSSVEINKTAHIQHHQPHHSPDELQTPQQQQQQTQQSKTFFTTLNPADLPAHGNINEFINRCENNDDGINFLQDSQINLKQLNQQIDNTYQQHHNQQSQQQPTQISQQQQHIQQSQQQQILHQTQQQQPEEQLSNIYHPHQGKLSHTYNYLIIYIYDFFLFCPDQIQNEPNRVIIYFLI